MALIKPKLLKPFLLIIALSLSNLKTLGLGFPYCGRGVIVPTSVNPKFKKCILFITSAFLSKPAAKPNGLIKLSDFILLGILIWDNLG